MFRRCCRCCKCYYNRNMDNYDITMEQVKKMINDGATVIDIRSPQEFNEGHINGAINIPDYEIRKSISKYIPRKNQQIVVYCGTGIRSKNAQRALQRMGYNNVYNLYKGTENY